MHSGHPLMVHLPLVALPFAVLLDAVAIWKQDGPWRQTATVLWGLGLVGAAAAVTTGLIAYNRVEHSDVGHEVMTLHRNVALGAVVLFLLSGAVRWRRPQSRPALGIGALAIAAIAGAGYLGGETVFRHAIGIPTEVLEQVMSERGGHGHQEANTKVTPAPPMVDSSGAPPTGDSAGGHSHRDSAAPHPH